MNQAKPKAPVKDRIEIRKEDINVHTLFHVFKSDDVQPYGAVPLMSVPAWIAKRKEAYRNYQSVFHVNNLHDTPYVLKEYKKWLLFENNMSWTQLHRVGYAALDHPRKLMNLLSLLQDEDISLGEKFDRGVKYPDRVYGIGEATLTGLLHTFNPDQNGVVNSRTRKTLEILRREPINTYWAESRGSKYVKINTELHKLADELESDLVYVDGFMWYVSKFYSFI